MVMFDYKSVPSVDVIQRAGINLVERGSLSEACCPFHSEETPSFKVYPQTNSWCCYGNCVNAIGFNNGDAVDFIKLRYNYTFVEAVKWIEENFGAFDISEPIELPKIHTVKKVIAPEIVTYWHNNLGDMREYFWNRGFFDNIIDREMWGWDGHRVCIPVWEGEPQNSDCVGVRKRLVDDSDEPKYIGLKGTNDPTVWGRWYCQDGEIALAFAGEFDAARAVQDKFSAFSVVNGVNSIMAFPDNWPELWFPNTRSLLIIFDRTEEVLAGRMAQMWNNSKAGFLSARIYHWVGQCTDYCEFRDSFSVDTFKHDVFYQMGIAL